MRTRKNIRLTDYDYRQNGLYFVTICSQNKRPIFGTIQHAQIHLTPIGQKIQQTFREYGQKYPDITIPQLLIMPNHIHAIIHFLGTKNTARMKLGQFINLCKGQASRACQKSIWQRGYYEHVIRHEKDLLKIMEYIENNPRKWEEQHRH